MKRYPTAAVLALVLAACAGRPLERDVEIGFVLADSGKAVSCSTPLTRLGKGGVNGRMSDARFYVSNMALITRDGRMVPIRMPESQWQHDGVALLDFEDATGPCRGTPATNSLVRGSAPAGDYTGLSFTVGIPSHLNHTATAGGPPPLDSVSMAWTWQAGRKFMKIEIDPEGGVARTGKPVSTWYLHLGSTGCKGDPATGEQVSCTNSNRIPVMLAAFDPGKQRVELDIKALFADTDLSRDGGGAPGCMSGVDDPDCPGVFTRLGLDRPTGQPLGAHPFTVAAKP